MECWIGSKFNSVSESFHMPMSVVDFWKSEMINKCGDLLQNLLLPVDYFWKFWTGRNLNFIHQRQASSLLTKTLVPSFKISCQNLETGCLSISIYNLNCPLFSKISGMFSFNHAEKNCLCKCLLPCHRSLCVSRLVKRLGKRKIPNNNCSQSHGQNQQVLELVAWEVSSWFLSETLHW